jgi:trypsin
MLVAALAAVLASVPSAPAASKIINGTDVPSAVPFVARITYFASDGPFLCTGSVVAPTVVLTAAHCAAAPRGFIVDIGRLDLYGAPFQEVRVSEVRVHPGWNPATGQNDAAVLILAEPTSAAPLRAATVADAWGYQPGFAATAFGWGRDSLADEGSLSTWLQSGAQTIGDDTSYCPLLNDEWRLYDPATMVCGHDPDEVTHLCHGDSGGPLVGVSPSGEMAILGITSWGEPTCGAGPTAYTRVSAVSDWINLQIAAPGPVVPPAAPAPAPTPVVVVSPPLAAPVVDMTAPTVRARASRGKRGTYVKLWFRASDDSGKVALAVAVRNKGRVLRRWKSRLGPITGGGSYYFRWRIPRTVTARLLVFCVDVKDGAGNAGAPSCARLDVRR